jgi:outer membrane protein assembly factor BamB
MDIRQMKRFMGALAAVVSLGASAVEREGASVPWISGVRFTLATQGPIRGSPLVDQGTVYVGSTDGFLYAADARTGALRWRFRAAGAVDSAPAAANGLVYFTSRPGILYALKAASGRLAWKVEFGPDLGTRDYWDYYLSSPVIAGASVIVGAGDGFVRSLVARTGKLRWRFDAGARVRSTPAVAEGFVVVGTASGHVVALHEGDGTLAWRFATAGASRKFEDESNDTTSVPTTPSISRGRVFVGARDSYLYALDLRRGEQLWRTTHDGSSWILSTLAVGDRLYVGSGSANVVQAADPATGAEAWRTPTRASVFARVVSSGDTLVVSDFAGNVHGIDRTSGEPLWRFPMGQRSVSTPAVADGIVYCASDSGVLFALDAGNAPPRSGNPRRIVYMAGAAPGAFSWFQNGVDAAVAAQLKGRGYEAMDTQALADFMRTYGPRSPRAVAVFVDNRMPAALLEPVDGTPLVRRFLDAGGKVALLGPNPLAYVTDTGGGVTGIDFGIPSRVFGVEHEPLEDSGGYYASAPTPEGRRIGLRSPFVASSTTTRDDAVEVFARDEFGRASAWLRGFGAGPAGLLELPVPRAEMFDIAQVQAAVEFGITW